MGFWHTGYMEFHDPCYYYDDTYYIQSPPVYLCGRCGATFLSPDELRTHLFESHPHSRPVLWVNGLEVGTTPIHITREIDSRDVFSGHCERAWLNGSVISPTDLGQELAALKNDTARIRLENDSVSADFTLRFEIASEEDITGVDRCFFNAARMRRLDRRAVEEFIAGARVYPSAIRYLDGICNYFYGVLTKEKSQESTLPYESYREKFTQAADALKDFNRPLARTIRALIAFHFNSFPESAALAESSRVGTASQRFVSWLNGDRSEARNQSLQPYDDSLERLLTDLDAERILSWCVFTNEALLPVLQDIEAMIKQDIPEFDRTKLRILLAELYAQSGSVSQARCHARELRNITTLGSWAEHVLDRLSEKD